MCFYNGVCYKGQVVRVFYKGVNRRFFSATVVYTGPPRFLRDEHAAVPTERYSVRMDSVPRALCEELKRIWSITDGGI